ncbi:MAG: hypothetical protein WC829_21745 [Hyphomicrobium sp.]
MKTFLQPQQIAERLIAELRADGLTDYPFIPADLDKEIERWCEANEVEPVSGILVREVMATLPGVDRTRPWLNQRTAEHRYIRRRQRAHGEESDRPTIYRIWGRD